MISETRNSLKSNSVSHFWLALSLSLSLALATATFCFFHIHRFKAERLPFKGCGSLSAFCIGFVRQVTL
jgi:hypothetical protein